MRLVRALETWANARERVIADLLAETDHQLEGPASLEFAVRHLTSRMIEERARARHIRSDIPTRCF
jgi:hypothetical protein